MERRATAPLWFTGGILSVGIGGVGVVVPTRERVLAARQQPPS